MVRRVALVFSGRHSELNLQPIGNRQHPLEPVSSDGRVCNRQAAVWISSHL